MLYSTLNTLSDLRHVQSSSAVMLNWKKVYYSRHFRDSIAALLMALMDRTKETLDLQPLRDIAKNLVQKLKEPITHDNTYYSEAMKNELRRSVLGLLRGTNDLIPELSELVIGNILKLDSECQGLSKFAKEYFIESLLSFKKSNPVVTARKSDKSKVVIKFFLNDHHTAEREKEMLEMCKSPHVISLIDYGTLITPQMSVEYLVFPYVENCLRNLSLEMKKKLFVQLLKALDWCHKKGVIHSDVKLSNILADQNNLYLTDFGVSIRTTKFETEGLLGYTFRYAAPEVLEEEDNKIGTALDMWSAGVVYCEWLWNTRIFEGGNKQEVLNSIHTSFTNGIFTHSLLLQLEESEKQLLRGLLQLDPKKRLSTSEALNFVYIIQFYYRFQILLWNPL